MTTPPKRYSRTMNLTLAERVVIIHAAAEATRPDSKMGGGMASMYHLLEIQKALDSAGLDDTLEAIATADRIAFEAWQATPQTTPRPKPTGIDDCHANFKLYGTTAKWARDAVMACRSLRGTPEAVVGAATKLGCDLSGYAKIVDANDIDFLKEESAPAEPIA